ncbi:MAG: hypothetical protein R3F59_01040 [Myxococcota bacterium]
MALAGFQRASALHLAGGRRVLAWLAEAGRVRAGVAAGLAVLVARLREGVAYAEARGLAPAEVELRLALGEGLAARDRAAAQSEVERALALAEALRLRHAAGRARLQLAGHARGERRAALLEAAAADLADDVPWRARVARAQA